MDESALIKKHVRSINFLRGISPRKDTSTGTSRGNSDGDSNNSFSVSCQSHNINSDRIDSIKSCESVLKIFTFETSYFNKNNEKCLAFWNALNERKDILPVDCTIMDANDNQRDSECQTEQKESEASLWARALYELRKKKLDVVALATSTETCKFCKTINCSHTSAGFSPNDLEEEDLTELDNWDPRVKHKTTQFTVKDLYEVKYIDATTSTPSQLCTLETMFCNDAEEYNSSFHNSSRKEQDADSEQVISNVLSKGFVPKLKEASIGGIDVNTDENNQLQSKAQHSSVVEIADFPHSDEIVSTTKSISEKIDMTKLRDSQDIIIGKSDEKVLTKPSPPGKMYETKLKESQDIEPVVKKKVSISKVISVSAPFFESTSEDIPLDNSTITKRGSTRKRTSLTLKKDISGSTSFKDKPVYEEVSGSGTSANRTPKSDGMFSGTPHKQISFFSDEQKKSNSPLWNLSKIASKEIQKESAGKLSRTKSNKPDVPAEDPSWNEVSSTISPIYESLPNIADPSIVKDTKMTSVPAMPSIPKVLHSILLSSTKKISPTSPKNENEDMSDAQKKSKVEFDQMKDQSTDIQHLSSLFYIETVKQLKMIAAKKEKLENELRRNMVKGSQADGKEVLDPKLYLCSCLEVLKKAKCNLCPCKEGICERPKFGKSDWKTVEQIFDHMPQHEKRKMKCFHKIIYQIKEIMEQDLNIETMDAKILEVLSGIDPCECVDEPCECKIHHIYAGTMKKNKDFIAATLLDKLSDALDERYEAKIGEALKKNPTFTNASINTEEPSVTSIGVPKKRRCNICEMQNCRCVAK